uniref:Structural maintenance of chromosomes flexible hinge domain containing 1 n=1 Tax=Sinocyclocheilus grahami TaxID=75366 RepID=A0A672P6A9_SINGR
MCDETKMSETGAERNRDVKPRRSVCVYDCRPESSAAPPRAVDISEADYSGFLRALRQEFSLSTNETFVISTTDRGEIDAELYKELVDGKTLHLFESANQKLTAATEERIEFLPHYHTLVQCGMYEYYASEGQKALPYAFAELIDNALSATARNSGIRRIEIRLQFDESQGGPAVVVMDNGCGMTSKQLNNWAVYRLSKFIRENGMKSEETGYVRPDPVPRSLNSDISYFGVGGKQAVFYIGQSVRMISKPAGSPDVHEFIMSKEDFERKQMNKEVIYSGFIRNRKPGDYSHVNESEEPFLRSIVTEEEGKESFTAVVITRVQQEHVTFLKHNFSLWTRELAHTYHYYIHGVDGNDQEKIRINDHVSNIDIQITLLERSPRVPRMMNLREVENDMQTLYINSSFSTFEFKATGAGDSLVEGLIRYHPFLYDRETYPVDPYALEDEDEDCVILNSEARGKRPIFECFWNGRLIPYTTVSDACAMDKSGGIASEPKELYDELRIVPISKIDRLAAAANIKKKIEDELAKLPDQLRVTWPEGNAWAENEARPAGTPMGPIKVEILNKKGDSMSRLPVAGTTKKLLMELKVIWHSPKGDVQTNSHIGVHSSKWEYWFKPMENLSKLGKYTLHLQTMLSDNSASEWAGKRLPNHTLKFSIKEGEAGSFVIGIISSPVHVGVPFSVPLDFRDEFDYPTQPPCDIKPQLECSSLQLSYEGIAFGTTCVIKNVRAMGKISHQNKMYTVKVHIPGLKQDSQSLQILLQPGPPHTLVVLPDSDVLSVENRTPANFRVEVHDEYQNITTQPKLTVRCQLLGAPDLPVDVVDCSNTGSGLLLTKPLLLKTVNAEQILTAKFNIPNHRTVACVERQLRVLPSSRISRLEIYRQEEGSDDLMVLQNAERIDWTAGDALGNLRFRLYDEGNRLVSLRPKLTSMIKVNWTADINAEELSQGKLPPLSVPSQAQREHFYHVSFHDQHTVNFSFIIVPRPDEPERLRVNLSESTVKMGEILSGNVYVELVDQYGNKTDCLNADIVKTLSVSADGLDKSALAVEWQASSGRLSVCRVRFVGGTPGPRELCFKYQDMMEFVRIEVTAGPPVQIKLLEKPEMPLQVVNGQGLDAPLVVQLCDEWGNPSPDQRIEIMMKALMPKLKIKSLISSQPVDSEGKACFVLETISGPKGVHQLQFRGTFGRKGIPGPVVKLNLIPDPNKPVELSIKYDSAASLRAGDIFPVFTVIVISEDGTPVRNICPANLSMLLWKGTVSGSYPPSTASTLKCSKRKDTENDDCFCFRDKQIPELAGQYVVQFVLALDETKHLWSKQTPLNVVANKAVKLAPEAPASTPVVSNSSNRTNRTLLDSLNLKIMDQYSNADLALLENSPGVDGAEYILQFSAEIHQKSVAIAPYILPLRFCNDAENQKVIVSLSKKKDRLSQTVLMYQEFFDTNNQLTSELECQVRDATHKLSELKPELMKCGLVVSELTTVSTIEKVINDKKAILTKIENQPLRKCGISDPFKGSPQVLGKVCIRFSCILAFVLIVATSNCLVTSVLQKYRHLYAFFFCACLFMCLRPLPHIRNGSPLFRPIGNPEFVKDMLIFPEHVESCNKVFASLLGDTILIDDLDSANDYRRGVVQNKMQCPTLLTRQGERIRSNGKFGGLQNKAPSIEKLRGQVFGAPLPKEYNRIHHQMELLQQCRVAMQKASEVRSEYNSHLEHLQSPEMKQKQQDLQQQEQELRELEETLGMCFWHCRAAYFLNAKPEFR